MRRIFLALLLMAGFASPARAAERECPSEPQPMPPAIESADLPPSTGFNNVITFAATPSLEYPARAWVVRLFQRSSSRPATLTIVRLVGRYECNIYDVETRWEMPLRADEYEAVAALVTPHVTPSTGLFDGKDMARWRGLVMDGTGLNLRVEASGWQVRRSLNVGEREGAVLSTIFHRLLAPLVPAAERPTEEWRARR